MSHDAYTTDDAEGQGWRLLLGDSCERLAELEPQSVDLSVFSPPFASLYTYSPSPRDLGNCSGTGEFIEHFGFVVDGLRNAMRPGRIACVHVQQIATTKAVHGIVGLTDFRGQVIAAFQRGGWTFHGEVTVDKDPQAQAIRTKAQALMFNTLRRDSAMTRPALADYLLLFRAPGENAVPIKADVDNDTWIQWARPVWYGIRESATLNAAAGRDERDERHIAPLQLPFIERVALQHGRRFVGIELKPSYFATACTNLRAAEQADLFSDAPLTSKDETAPPSSSLTAGNEAA